ncbi:MAG: hypothetical protein ACE5GQ_09160, partial [Nitrospinales bacterium]
MKTQSNSQTLSFSLMILFALLLLASVYFGPDFVKYLDWARAARSGNIFELRGDMGSPMGVPFSQWSPGPGMFFSLAKRVLGGLVDDIQAAYLMGWLGSLVFWWALFKILNRVAEGRLALTCFGLGAAFLGTHAGIYSLNIASESSAYPFGAVLALWLIAPRKWGLRDLLLAGTAAAMLVSIRSQLAIYAAPALAAIGFLTLRKWADEPLAGKIGKWTLLVTPTAASVMQAALTNRWMTGSFFHPAHDFGSGSFKSVDWSNPEILATLFHPWHGLLIYNPLYAVC